MWSCFATMGSTVAMVVVAIFLLQGTCGLRMGRLKVPPYRVKGENALLVCDYDMEDDAVYSVKWYKDDEEFYRYVPKSSPPKSSYMVPGVKVDHVLSDDKTVALRSVNLQSSGLYRCEVSAEAPSFASAQKEARMEVVYLPKEGPYISGDQEYQLGDEINLNCTSSRSYPASVLHWYIDDQQVSRQDWLVQLPDVVHQHGLVTSALGLRFRLSSPPPAGAALQVRCVAGVSPGLWRDDRHGLFPLRDYARETLLFVKASSSNLSCSGVLVLMMTSLATFTTT